MKRLTSIAVVVALGLAAPAAAQDWEADTGVASAHQMYNTAKQYLLASAEQVPEDLYDYRPAEEVRSFGQIIGHMANAFYGFCTTALGERPSMQENYEQRTSKAGLIEALQGAIEFCDRAHEAAYGAPDEMVSLFGNQVPRTHVLVFNAAHAFEHYGNLVTYMRANGMVPPSSQGGM